MNSQGRRALISQSSLPPRPAAAALACALFSSAAPVPQLEAPAPWRRGLRYEIWDYVRGRYEAARKRALFVGVGFVAVVAYAVYTWGPEANSGSTYNAFEKGALGGMGNKWDDDAHATVPRPALERKLGKVLRPAYDTQVWCHLRRARHGQVHGRAQGGARSGL